MIEFDHEWNFLWPSLALPSPVHTHAEKNYSHAPPAQCSTSPMPPSDPCTHQWELQLSRQGILLAPQSGQFPATDLVHASKHVSFTRVNLCTHPPRPATHMHTHTDSAPRVMGQPWILWSKPIREAPVVALVVTSKWYLLVVNINYPSPGLLHRLVLWSDP